LLDAPEGQEYTPASSTAPTDEVPLPAPEDLPSTEEEVPQRRLLLVSVPDDVVALPAEPVVEVITARPYARLPGAATSVAGLVNRRGRLLTVVDLGRALGKGSAAADAEHRIVVVAFRGREVGIAVKDVLQFTVDWWSQSADAAPEVPVAEIEGRVPDEGREHLSVVDVESLLAPLFGSDGARAGEPSPERS
jgi:chemotaxis signal transduction protein